MHDEDPLSHYDLGPSESRLPIEPGASTAVPLYPGLEVASLFWLGRGEITNFRATFVRHISSRLIVV